MKRFNRIISVLALASAMLLWPGEASAWDESGAAIITLCSDCQCSLRFSGVADLDTGQGTIQVNSDHPCAACSNGSSVYITTPELNVVGGVCFSGGTEVEGEINEGVDPIPDPLGCLPAPMWDPANDLACTVEPGATLEPGYYSAGIKHTVGTLALLPGVYVLGGPEYVDPTAPPTVVNFDNDGSEEGVTPPGTTDFSFMGSSWTGGVVASHPTDDDPPLFPLAASGEHSYVIQGGGGTVTFDPPVESVEFFYVHSDKFGVPAGVATVIDICGNTIGSVGSNPATGFNDPDNFVAFSAPEHPIAHIEISAGAIDAFAFSAAAGGLQVGLGDGLVAEGVMLYLLGGRLDIVAHHEVIITPLRPELHDLPEAETYEDVSIFQDRNNSNPGRIILTTKYNVQGALYLPEADIEFGGYPGPTLGAQLIAQNVFFFYTGAGVMNFHEPGADGSCCPIDLSKDGVVGAFDLALLLGAWGPNPGHRADFDGDGDVGPLDLAVLLGAWGPCE